MKAILQTNYQGIDGLAIAEVNTPTSKPFGDLVKVTYVPVLPWDIKNETGELIGVTSQRLPKIIGYSFAGTIEAPGSLSTKKAGQKVIGVSQQGTSSEYVAANLPFVTFKIPDNVSLKTAATIFGGADTALMMTHATQLAAGQHILIIGASGGVGSYLVQLAENLGVKVSILASARSFAFLQTQFPKATVYQQADQLPQEYFDRILDTAGNTDLLQQVEVSLKAQSLLFSAALPYYQPVRTDISFRFDNKPIMPHHYQKLLHALATGSLHALIDEVYPATAIKEAQKHVLQAPSRGRTLIRF